MEKSEIYNIVKIVAELRSIWQAKRTSLNYLGPGERIQLLMLKEQTPLIQHIAELDEYFEFQNDFLSLIRTYIQRRLLVGDDEYHHSLILKEENRIDAALNYITTDHPTILTPSRSLQKHIAA